MSNSQVVKAPDFDSGISMVQIHLRQPLIQMLTAIIEMVSNAT